MKHLATCKATLRAVAGGRNCVPKETADLLEKAVSTVSVDEFRTLLDKHESDPGNFDCRLRQIIQELRPSLSVHANHRILEEARFNHDIVLETEEVAVFVEIEKGYLARFEFDILKMQASAGQWKVKRPGAKVFGAFIVPADNVVAAHISGNSRESSFKYLQRLGRLVSQINPPILDDILIVGYSAAPLAERIEPTHRRPIEKQLGEGMAGAANVVTADAGLLPPEVVSGALRGYPKDMLFGLREVLSSKCPRLREKLNKRSRYLGYSNGGGDAMYVYVRKKDLLLDVRLSADLTEELQGRGFVVRPRDNYQAKAGWLTGLIVPHDSDKMAEVAQLAIEALTGE